MLRLILAVLARLWPSPPRAWAIRHVTTLSPLTGWYREAWVIGPRGPAVGRPHVFELSRRLNNLPYETALSRSRN